jgi:hypothetical protein
MFFDFIPLPVLLTIVAITSIIYIIIQIIHHFSNEDTWSNQKKIVIFLIEAISLFLTGFFLGGKIGSFGNALAGLSNTVGAMF